MNLRNPEDVGETFAAKVNKNEASLAAPTGSTEITEKRLLALGFKHQDLGDMPPYEQWVRDDVEVWWFNTDFWIVDALDQAGIDVEFRTLEQLAKFWDACNLPKFLYETSIPARLG